MSQEPSGKNLGEFFGDFRKAYTLAGRIEDKHAEKVFTLIHLQKRYKERRK